MSYKPQTVKRSEIIAAARSFRGIPFHHAARSMAGVDCVGLLIMVARKLGLPHTDDPHYRMRPQPGRLMESLRRSGLVEVAEAKPGDVVAFDCSRRGVPYHVGILATFDGRPTVIHAIARGRVEEVSFDGEWESKHVSSWAYPGLEN